LFQSKKGTIMQIYNYNATTGEYLGATEALQSPLEPGKFLIPAGATATAPPKAKAKHAIVWQGDEWGYAKDYRDEVRYSTDDGREVKIDKLGAIAEVAPDTTDAPRPSEHHRYGENGWELDVSAYKAAMLAQFTALIQARLDAFAQTRNYDNILSAASYATSQNPVFSAEGQYAVVARDDTWARAYEILAEVESGAREMPTEEGLLAELPTLSWPV
jgi:hypothetical protein